MTDDPQSKSQSQTTSPELWSWGQSPQSKGPQPLLALKPLRKNVRHQDSTIHYHTLKSP